jgi:predicted regulator of Ras-like GTPase activity (Roadblock/LC7/MglB family)
VTLAEEMRHSLATLRDVAGVTGSFLFTQAGRVVARELPDMFDDVALAEAGGRLARLRDTFGVVGDELELAVLRYGEHKLMLKTMSGGMLCIVADRTVNMPAIRMAANLVGRRIARALEREAAAPPQLETPRSAAPTSPARPAVMAPPGMRRFRGQPVE